MNPIPTSVMKPGKALDTLWQYMTSKEEVIPKKKPGPFVTDATIYNVPPVGGLQ